MPDVPTDLGDVRSRRTPHSRRQPRRLLVLTVAVLSIVGAVAAVALGVVRTPFVPAAPAAISLASGHVSAQDQRAARADLAARGDRAQSASRSSLNRVAAAARLKASSLRTTTGRALSGSVNLSQAAPQTIAKALLPQFGWSQSEFGCLDQLWLGESGWNLHATNPYSGAYGIPQALPASKMGTAGPDWQNNAETQIRWGLGYIRSSYGSPCGAWSFKEGNGWY